MTTIEMQIFINSGIFTFLMARFASSMTGAGHRWRLAIFVLMVFSANILLLADRFEPAIAFEKSAMISFGFLVGTIILALLYSRKKKPD
jgi:hypothetical protein